MQSALINSKVLANTGQKRAGRCTGDSSPAKNLFFVLLTCVLKYDNLLLYSRDYVY